MEGIHYRDVAAPAFAAACAVAVCSFTLVAVVFVVPAAFPPLPLGLGHLSAPT